MDNDKNILLLYESAMARMERANKRLWIVALILIAVILLTNAGWIIYESQYQVTETSIEADQDGDGINIVGNGDVMYGADSENQDEIPDP